MKEEIVKRVQELLASENFGSIRQEMRKLQQEFQRASEDAEDLALKNHLEGGGLMSDFNPEKNPIDDQFSTLYTEYREKKKVFEEKEKAQSAEQIETKKSLLTQMTELASNVANIDSAFDKFKKIQDEWKNSGSFYNTEIKKLRFDFNHQRDVFFYNMQINKDLRSEHYKRNLEAKKAVTAEIKELLKEPNPNVRASKLRELQREWFNVGPVEYGIKDEVYADFNQAGNIVYDELKSFFDEKDAEKKENLKKKIELCDRMNVVNEAEYASHQDWDKASEDVLALQNEWKTIGYSAKSQTVWSVFRGMINTFFDNKRSFYKGLDEVKKENTVKKKELVEKADTVKLSTEWKETTNFLIGLQKEWKEIGPALRGKENKLWKQFREACDAFFEAKKQHFSEQDEAYQENLTKKKALIEEVKKFELSGNTNKDFQDLKEFSKTYASIGFVPFKEKEKLYSEFKSALDKKYDKLNIDKAERFKSEYNGRLEGMQGSENAKDLIHNERKFIRRKIEFLKEDISNYEANLGLFGKSNNKENPLRAQVEKSIQKLRKEIDQWQMKLNLLKEKPVAEDS